MASAAGDRPVYSISAVARMVGIPVATLRTWEDRYGQVVPARNANGHRLYSRRQVEQLRFIRTQMGEGATVADAHRLLAERNEMGQSLATPPVRPAPRLLIQLAEPDVYAAELQEFFLKTEGFDVEVTPTDCVAREAFTAARPAVAVAGGGGDRGGVGGRGHGRADRRGRGRVPPQAARSAPARVHGPGPAPVQRHARRAGALMNDGRLRSGHRPLDEVLGGGLPDNGITVIMGLPGTGKTILAEHYTFHNATPDRPAVYFSTLSEPLEK